MKWGKPRRPALNVTIDYNDDLKQLSVTPNKGSNAQKSGIPDNSVLLKVNNNPVSNYSDLFNILKSQKDGDNITVETLTNKKVSTHTFELENWEVLEVKTD